MSAIVKPDLISPEHLEDIKKNCLFWSNNCGGCETCEREFRNPPLYDHQETYYLICMIEDRDKKIAELEKALKLASGSDTIKTTL